MSDFLVVLGTRNQKKRNELTQLLQPHGFQLKTLDDYSDSIEVEETGSTFRENANLKASEQATNLNCWVLGEDSGLSVDKLDGAPGIYSARYSGPNGTDQTNNEKLLAELGDTPWEQRSAHYTCHMALSNPEGNVRINCEGQCHGRIRFKESGEGGFGYDPLFELVEWHQTFGELSSGVKSILSHRARAMRLFVPLLLKIAQSDG